MTHRPHDALFKAAFGTAEGAAGLLRAIMPSAIVEAIAWTSLAVEPSSFIDEELEDLHSDILFSARLRDGDKVLLYVLVEHQSSPDAHMPLRMLAYLVRIWERFRGRTPHERLPVIVPVLISHAPDGWTEATTFDALLAPAPSTLGVEALVPRFELCVLDLAHRTDDEIRAWTLGTFQKLALMLLRDARDDARLDKSLTAWREQLRELHETALRASTGMRAFSQLVRYIWLVAGSFRFQTFHARLVKQLPGGQETVMTIYEEIIGEGIQRGRTEGRTEGLAEAVRVLMTMKFGALDAAVDERISSATSAVLERYLKRVLASDSAAAVIADEAELIAPSGS